MMSNAQQSIRMRVLRLFAASPGGMTCDEVERRLGEKHRTVSARIRELVLQGAIYDMGLRRRTPSGRGARVYFITMFGRTLAG